MKSQDYPINALPRGYMVENFRITDVLGVGGFGITYLAEDVKLKSLVAIKEYFPTELAVRGASHTINPSQPLNHPSFMQLHPKSKADEEDFNWGLDRFLEEARTVAKFKHPNIVQVKQFCEANNTAYFIMDYEDGDALNNLLKSGESVDEDEIYKLIMPLLEGLKEVHGESYLHRDLSPSNIYIQDKKDNPILIDFGAARQSLSNKSKSISTIVKIGYAPYEQYQANGNQGPWSDIYAIGAVLYQLISGSVPLESTERINAMVNNLPDPLPPAIKIGKRKYSKKLLNAIDWALSVREKDRPQDIDEFIEALEGRKPANTENSNHNAGNKKTRTEGEGIKPLNLALGVFGVACLLVLGIWITSIIPGSGSGSDGSENLSEEFLECVADGKENCERFK